MGAEEPPRAIEWDEGVSEPGSVLQYFAPENWLEGPHCYDHLVRYAKKAGDPRFERLAQFVSRPQDVIELAEASVLIWYLDSGGARDYRFAEKPDQLVRMQPAPDFVLCDELGIGQPLALELTSLVVEREMTGAIPVKRRIALHLREILERSSDDLPGGTFEVAIGPGKLRGRNPVEELERIARATANAMRSLHGPGDDGVLVTDAPFLLTVKMREATGETVVRVEPTEVFEWENRALEMMRGLAMRRTEPKDWEETMREWRIPDGYTRQLSSQLKEAERKMTYHSADHTTAVLVSFPYAMLQTVANMFEMRIASAYGPVYSRKVHRFYMLYQDDMSMQFRIRRAW